MAIISGGTLSVSVCAFPFARMPICRFVSRGILTLTAAARRTLHAIHCSDTCPCLPSVHAATSHTCTGWRPRHRRPRANASKVRPSDVRVSLSRTNFRQRNGQLTFSFSHARPNDAAQHALRGPAPTAGCPPTSSISSTSSTQPIHPPSRPS